MLSLLSWRYTVPCWLYHYPVGVSSHWASWKQNPSIDWVTLIALDMSVIVSVATVTFLWWSEFLLTKLGLLISQNPLKIGRSIWLRGGWVGGWVMTIAPQKACAIYFCYELKVNSNCICRHHFNQCKYSKGEQRRRELRQLGWWGNYLVLFHCMA